MMHTPSSPRGPALRPSPKAVAFASVVAAALLVVALYWHARPATDGPPLVVYVAASVRPAAEAAACEYEADTGRRVELHYGASEDLLVKATAGDVFLPADDSYVRLARDRGLVADERPLATMRAVVLTSRGNPKGVARWADLTRPDVTVALANPSAAVGKLVRERLVADGRWAKLEPRVVANGTVVESANAAKVGAADAAIVWDAVASRFAGGEEPRQQVLPMPELAGVVARVSVAVLSRSHDPAAAQSFAQFLASERGAAHFRAAGFTAYAPEAPK